MKNKKLNLDELLDNPIYNSRNCRNGWVVIADQSFTYDFLDQIQVYNRGSKLHFLRCTIKTHYYTFKIIIFEKNENIEIKFSNCSFLGEI